MAEPLPYKDGCSALPAEDRRRVAGRMFAEKIYVVVAALFESVGQEPSALESGEPRCSRAHMLRGYVRFANTAAVLPFLFGPRSHHRTCGPRIRPVGASAPRPTAGQLTSRASSLPQAELIAVNVLEQGEQPLDGICLGGSMKLAPRAAICARASHERRRIRTRWTASARPSRASSPWDRIDSGCPWSWRPAMLPATRRLVLVTLLAYVNALGCSGASSSPESNMTSGGSKSFWVESALASIRVDKGKAGGMRGCTGNFTHEARIFFTDLYTEASKCAAAAPSVKVSVTFHSTLEEGGGLSELSVLDDKLGAPGLIECIQAKAPSIEFPKVDAKTPCVPLVHPMTFP